MMFVAKEKETVGQIQSSMGIRSATVMTMLTVESMAHSTDGTTVPQMEEQTVLVMEQLKTTAMAAPTDSQNEAVTAILKD